MRTTRICLVTLALTASGSILAQDFIHYKFDSPCTTEVINYATGPQALASNGTIQSTLTGSSYTAGVFGGALAAGSLISPTTYNKVLTGWDPSVQNVTGDLTMAWFMREASPLGSAGTTIDYLAGAPNGGFRLFTNGVAGRGLYQRVILAGGGNGINATITNDFYLPATTYDVQTAAQAGWVHIAMVVDSTAQTADWYVNGTSVLQLTGVPGALISAAGPFMIGAYSTTAGGSAYEMDEFVMSLRAYSATEVLQLSLAQMAGDGDYTSGSTTQCGTLGLASTGGRPSLGNASYALEVTPTAPSLFAIQFGFTRCLYAGTFQLPFDGGLLHPLGTGCTVLADGAVTVSGVATTGPASFPFPIPAAAGFSSVQFYTQALAVNLGTFAVSASNGFTFSLGY
ncbi:MAG: hypothetical protein KDC98_10155 [Planctomycetes bacterium]|nr:hypothetical protein [Planctomycetota bacterium]